MNNRISDVVKQNNSTLLKRVENRILSPGKLQNMSRVIDKLKPLSVERRIIELSEKRDMIISTSPFFIASKRNAEAVKRMQQVEEVARLSAKIDTVSIQIEEIEEILEKEDLSIVDNKVQSISLESTGKMLNIISRFFSKVDDSEGDFGIKRKELIESEALENIDLSDVDWGSIFGDVLVQLVGSRDRFITLRCRVENNLSRVNRSLDLRNIIRHFLDRMYRYNNDNEEEGSSYLRITNTEEGMNYLNLLHHAIKKRNIGVFRLTP